MARHDVMTMVPAASYQSANNFMVGMFGDDPGSEEISLNAYLDGQDPAVATHSLGVANCSQADTNSLAGYMAATSGCDSKTYPTAGSGANFWADALALWNLKPAVPTVP